jgi:hypothetical protein
MVGPPPGSQPDRAEYSNSLPEIPDFAGGARGGRPRPRVGGRGAYPVQFPASQYQSYMLKVQTTSFGCTPCSREVSLLTTTCW